MKAGEMWQSGFLKSFSGTQSFHHWPVFGAHCLFVAPHAPLPSRSSAIAAELLHLPHLIITFTRDFGVVFPSDVVVGGNIPLLLYLVALGTYFWWLRIKHPEVYFAHLYLWVITVTGLYTFTLKWKIKSIPRTYTPPFFMSVVQSGAHKI